MSVLDYIKYRKSDSAIGLKNFLMFFGNFYAITIKIFREKEIRQTNFVSCISLNHRPLIRSVCMAMRWTSQVHYYPLVQSPTYSQGRTSAQATQAAAQGPEPGGGPTARRIKKMKQMYCFAKSPEAKLCKKLHYHPQLSEKAAPKPLSSDPTAP